jgi:hypothetical protein
MDVGHVLIKQRVLADTLMSHTSYGPISWARMIRAVEKVRERQMRATGDGVDGRTRDAIKIVFAREQARPSDGFVGPSVDESETFDGYHVLTLDALVRMLLSAQSAEDGMLLRDLIDVGLVDAAWLNRLPGELAPRLKEVLDNPER